MKEFKHQQLLHRYQLDIERMPAFLRTSYDYLGKLPNSKEYTIETEELIGKLDKTLTVGILHWIKFNENNLEAIISVTNPYHEFYKIVFEKLITEGFQKSSYQSRKSDSSEQAVRYEINFLKENSFSDCYYFSFSSFMEIPGIGMDELRFITKICEGEETIEPISYKSFGTTKEIQVYNYLNGNSNPHLFNKGIIDIQYNSFIKDILEKGGIQFIKNPISLVLTQLKITQS